MAEPGPVVAGYIARWSPPSVSPAAAGFARDVVARASPQRPDRAKSLLYAAARLADWAAGTGLDPVAAVLLHPSVIERFAAHSPGLSPPSRRTLRTNLRFLGRRIVPHLHPADAPLSREHARQPYAPAEIAGFLALAAAQPTAGRRARATALVCLGAGAGLAGGDLREIRGTDVAARSGGVVVIVGSGPRPRVVPVLARYRQPLLESAAWAGTRLIIGGRDPARRNLTYPLTAALAGGTGLPRLEAARLRATWLRDCADLLGLATFMHAAGITCSQRLGDIIAGLRPGSEAEAVRLLGGNR
jgi:hypothetical protein